MKGRKRIESLTKSRRTALGCRAEENQRFAEEWEALIVKADEVCEAKAGEFVRQRQGVGGRSLRRYPKRD